MILEELRNISNNILIGLQSHRSKIKPGVPQQYQLLFLKIEWIIKNTSK
jgi:hypothetical protein